MTINQQTAQRAPRPTVESIRTPDRRGNWRHTKWIWTPPALFLLADLLATGLSDAAIARRLTARFGHRFTPVAVQIARKRHGIKPRTKLALNACSTAKLLGIGCSKSVVRWIEQGWLKGRRQGQRGGNRQWRITEDALLAFLSSPEHWHRWQPERITDRYLREWALELRGGERYLTLREVAERFFVETKTVNMWIARGYLLAVRNGNHLIPASALEGFVPPGQRPKHGMRLVRFTPAEDARLRDLHAANWSWQAIADELGRSVGSIYGRAGRLGLLGNKAA